jgi:signal transduction histidine kinase
LAELRTRNDETLAEIRTLSRGFAPPILAEQGLRPAIASLAAAAPLPASLTTELAGPRPSDEVERAIYFAVSEGLANAAKYSGATAAAITVRQSAAGISAEVTDNGGGGASLLPGHGLAGLSDRLASVGGTLSVTSPAGGGTTVRAEVPFK